MFYFPPSGEGNAIDSKEPISIELSKGKAVQVRGRIDRIDAIGPPEVQRFAIWDYKSGGDYGYKQDDPELPPFSVPAL